MLVSVENLEEAGEYVSFRLQIRRYSLGLTPPHLPSPYVIPI